MDFIDLKTQYSALRESVNARIQRVLDHGQYVMGPEVKELEDRLATWTGARHCLAVASGTEALLIALMALGVKAGDEVVTTPFTFVANAEMIALIGAKPVFVDVEEDTANIDVSKLEAAITPRTRAIMPVSLYGQPADMDEINAIAARRKLPVIEDAAQSFGATYKGRKSCNLSTIGCTSFFPSKPLGCYGDGGAIFTSDDALATAMREIRIHGQSGRYHHTRIGVGGRMDSIQCAVVLAKMDRFEWEVRQRIEIGAHYDALLVPAVRTLKVKQDRTSVYAQYTVRVAARARFEQELKARGIPSAVHYPLSLHQQPAYAAGYVGQSFPVSEALAREVISLPMHADLNEATQQQVVFAVREALRGG
ncbi:MAG: DegT/DnrJ/EryC1/StrS family aminotransferase [Candidatus Parcubacteria bacterium]|nr:DegT/DnrJ/EryC1/StrS family aminotransferase [Burkholderiales bacterium]